MTLWTVLEHIVEPGPFLESVRRLLAPHGVLLILVPNFESLAVRVLHEKAVTFAGDSHVNHFSAATLTRLIETSGMEVLDCETLLTEIGTVNNYLNFADPYFGESRPTLDVLTPQYLHEQKLGYLLQVIARPSDHPGPAARSNIVRQAHRSNIVRQAHGSNIVRRMQRMAVVLASLSLLVGGSCPLQADPRPAKTGPAAKPCKPAASEVWQVNYFGKSRIGHTRIYTHPVTIEGKTLLKCESETHLAIKRFGDTVQFDVRQETDELPDGSLRAFVYR